MTKKEQIKTILGTIYHQKLTAYLDDAHLLHEIAIKNDAVTCTFIEPAGSCEIHHVQNKIEEKIFELNWVKELEIKLRVNPSQSKQRDGGLKNVNHIIAISSCKGGVGKSTIAMNIATAFHLNGAKIGLFDADIHGPSLPTLITPTEMATSTSEDKIPPFINNGIKLMSYGYIQESTNQPAILRGPIASNLFKQLLLNTDWGHLDALIIDCPPGTGDILLSITQEIELSSAIIITTPHELSYVDVKKGIEMFKKVKVPITSIIENMSYYTPPESNEKHHIFGKGRLIPTAQEYGIPHWLELPINDKLAAYNNKKNPYLMSCDEEESSIYKKLVNDLVWANYLQAEDHGIKIEFNNDEKKLTITHNNEEKYIPYEILRSECQCAFCVDEMSREKIFKTSDLDPNLRIKKCFKVGHYAYGIEWKEHHKTHHSMYPTDALLSITLELTGNSNK